MMCNWLSGQFRILEKRILDLEAKACSTHVKRNTGFQWNSNAPCFVPKSLSVAVVQKHTTVEKMVAVDISVQKHVVDGHKEECVIEVNEVRLRGDW